MIEQDLQGRESITGMSLGLYSGFIPKYNLPDSEVEISTPAHTWVRGNSPKG